MIAEDAQTETGAAERARFVRSQMPSEGLFAGHDWRVSPNPFRLGPELAADIDSLGRVLLQFYRAVNLLYRKSLEGKQPEWVARCLDYGKPPELLALQRSPTFKNELPRVIRPDLLISENGLSVTELDSVPGGIGLTAWLNQTYSNLPTANGSSSSQNANSGASANGNVSVIGGPDAMLRGFESIFDGASTIHVVISE